MISFKDYFNLIQESPTMIKYGSRILDMTESAITFITSQDDFYAFQNITQKIPPLIHIDDQFKVVETPPLANQKSEMYHEELGAIFGLDLGMNTEGMYVRGRLWIDPQDINRMLVSIWSYQDEFKPFVKFFENSIKKLLPKASEFTYEYAYFSQKGIDFSNDIKIKGVNTKEIKKEKTETEKLKERRIELISLWHLTTVKSERLKIKKEGEDVNIKLGKDPSDGPWGIMNIEPKIKSNTYNKDGSYRYNREGD